MRISTGSMQKNGHQWKFQVPLNAHLPHEVNLTILCIAA